jgi:hypothetical protein
MFIAYICIYMFIVYSAITIEALYLWELISQYTSKSTGGVSKMGG